MIHIVIGLIVGIIMGLTGAGGALISIPLFMHLIGASLKEATVLSLIAVLLGTGINLIGQLKRVDKKIVLYFSFFGGVANYLTLSLKNIVSEMLIASLLVAIGSYSLWNVWQKKKTSTPSAGEISVIKLMMTGLALGLITTLTGLGGGVILVPILIAIFNKSYDDALPTSLATIFLISSMSLVMQFQSGIKLITLSEIFLIGLGAVISYGVLKLILKQLSSSRVDALRKIVFTVVVLYSLTTVLIKISWS